MTNSNTRSGNVPGAKVIAYYADADGQYSANKIGYDVDLFEKSARKIALDEIPRNHNDRDSSEPDLDMGFGLFDDETNPYQMQTEESIRIRKESLRIQRESIKFIRENMEVDAESAAKALKHCNGSLEEALLHLIHEDDSN